MKTIKFKIEDFFNNELKNQTKIVGGSFGPGIIIVPPFQGGGPAVTGGTGNLEQNPTGNTGSTGPIIINDPNKM